MRNRKYVTHGLLLPVSELLTQPLSPSYHDIPISHSKLMLAYEMKHVSAIFFILVSQ